MENSKFNETVESIISSIKRSGHDPYAQIYGYLTSGNDMYITRTGNARELIKQVDSALLWEYVREMEKKHGKKIYKGK